MNIYFCSMGSDRKYTSIFMKVLLHVHHIVYFIMILNKVCPFFCGMISLLKVCPFSCENINITYIIYQCQTWQQRYLICLLSIKYFPTQDLSFCGINYPRPFATTDTVQIYIYIYMYIYYAYILLSTYENDMRMMSTVVCIFNSH